MDELTAWLKLARAPGLHGGIVRELLREGADIVAVATAPAPLLRAAGAGDAAIEWLRGDRDAALGADRRWLEGANRHFVPLDSEHYPGLLAQLPDPPLGLFVRGDPALLSQPQLAIVGSRNPTPAGRDNAAAFAAHLARCSLTITSGLAIGIDAASHRAALDAGGTTIAVCGTGLDVDYPSAHTALAAQIAARGALVSEFPLGTPAAKSHFPRRNRIISGLSLGTLVVEAAVRSGSLITARLAAEQGREVFAIPGSIHNPLARGCHRLIRQGAKLVETADDIFVELRALLDTLEASAGAAAGPPATAQGAARGAGTHVHDVGDFRPALDKDYEILLDALGFEPASVDVLVVRTGLKAEEVASMLLILELEERIESYPGGLYVRRVRK